MEEKVDHLYAVRHSLAHLLASAVLELYPNAKPTLGPPVDNGFYYDFDFGDEKVTDEDLKKIQKAMRKKLSSWHEFSPEEKTAEEAKEFYAGNPYKLEIIEDIIESGETITFYTSGDFTDLCRGGHVTDMAKEVSGDMFKLDKLAGAYWRGDETRPMLTRIYGLAFASKEDLDAYLEQREEAKKRDHRKLGKELDLFTFSDLVGPGLPLFTPKGSLMRDLIIEKIQNIQKDLGYERVTIPHITKKDLYETSGHWEKFGDELFKVKGKSGTEFVMKPMNCPHHTQIYASQPRSYRDLPVRYMESTMVYRDEQAGELLGLSRVRSITQDDGHVFCRPDQMKQEINNIIHVIREFYSSLDMWNEETCWVSLSSRDPQEPAKYLGDPKLWDEAETVLAEVADEAGLNWKKVEGEAAFYGPKLDFMFKDAIGREWQLATAQLDFNMPRRFELEYTTSEGGKEVPVMIHRAIAGSLERFMSVIIEHFAGAFPVWLSPIQIAILPVSDAHDEYAQSVRDELKKHGVRTELLSASDSLGKRMRNVKKAKTPFWIVIGDKEQESEKFTMEGRDENTTQDAISVEAIISTIKN